MTEYNNAAINRRIAEILGQTMANKVFQEPSTIFMKVGPAMIAPLTNYTDDIVQSMELLKGTHGFHLFTGGEGYICECPRRAESTTPELAICLAFLASHGESLEEYKL